MTASIGTGKGKSTAKAFEHILEICANLDTEEVQTVGDKEDLQKYLNIPLESEFISVHLKLHLFVLSKHFGDNNKHMQK